MNLTAFVNGLQCNGNSAMMLQQWVGSTICWDLAMVDDSVQPALYTGQYNPSNSEAYIFSYSNGLQRGCISPRAAKLIFICDPNADESTVGCTFDEPSACQYSMNISTKYACSSSLSTTTTTTSVVPWNPNIFIIYSNTGECKNAYLSLSVVGNCLKDRLMGNDCKQSNSIEIEMPSSVSSESCAITAIGNALELVVKSFSVSAFYFLSAADSAEVMMQAVYSSNIDLKVVSDHQFKAVSKKEEVGNNFISFPLVQGLVSIFVYKD